MTMLEQIEKEKQLISRCEKSLALEKLKKRKADTRLKIELGGLVIKSGMGKFNRSIILGSLDYAAHLIQEDLSYKLLFKRKGENLFEK
ncbi:conjugal transfer protein TraD [Legionella pneumophila]|nr:conjugal transfer protein TraD [Legionella pneumophila]HAT4425248.1 conjugal transfer protein TraD [Legionella pneumophila]HAU1721759.1 conjugal transfer protein TraD [Legionella pneumophila]